MIDWVLLLKLNHKESFKKEYNYWINRRFLVELIMNSKKDVLMFENICHSLAKLIGINTMLELFLLCHFTL